MIIFEVSAQLNFINSFNRVFSVYVIFLYEKVFSNFNTYIMICMAYAIAIVMCTTFYELLECYLYFHADLWIFSYPETEHCNHLTWYCDFIFNIVLVNFTLILNLIAAFKSRKLHRKITFLAPSEVSNRRQRELNFIRQSFCQGLFMSISLIFYHFTAPLISNKILLFLNASFWAFMLAFEGLVLFLKRCNSKLYSESSF